MSNISKNQEFRGIGRDKEVWFSICSMHRIRNPKCHMCNAGKWVNLRDHFFESIIHDTNKKLWKKHFIRPVEFEPHSVDSSMFL